MASSAVCRRKRMSFTDYVKYKAKRWDDEIIRGGKDEEKKKNSQESYLGRIVQVA
jgi:hypothetical protein